MWASLLDFPGVTGGEGVRRLDWQQDPAVTLGVSELKEPLTPTSFLRGS